MEGEGERERDGRTDWGGEGDGERERKEKERGGKSMEMSRRSNGWSRVGRISRGETAEEGWRLIPHRRRAGLPSPQRPLEGQTVISPRNLLLNSRDLFSPLLDSPLQSPINPPKAPLSSYLESPSPPRDDILLACDGSKDLPLEMTSPRPTRFVSRAFDFRALLSGVK